MSSKNVVAYGKKSYCLLCEKEIQMNCTCNCIAICCTCIFKVNEIEYVIKIGETEYVEENKEFEFLIRCR